MAEQKPSTKPKYPHVKVQLVGHDGNAFAILGRVTQQMRRHGLTDAEVETFMSEAMAGDYHDLLATASRWVDVS
jgi:hypothetical protein